MAREQQTHMNSRSHCEAEFSDSTDTFTFQHEPSGLAIGECKKTSWLNPTYKGSMPWGVQARLGTRPSTPSPSNPSSDHESSTTTAFAFAGSTASLDKQQQPGLYLAPPLERLATSSSIEMPGSIRSVQRGLSSTDSLDLWDSPIIVPLNFPSPPAKPNHFVERYTASQVTPPCLRSATPEATGPAHPSTPTLDTPVTGRFQDSSRSYPSPVQAGFRTPSSRYSGETQGRRGVSGSSFATARALTFEGNRTPSSDTSAIRDHTRKNSFGGAVFPASPLDAPSPQSTRTQEVSRDGYRGQRRNFSYGLDVLEEPNHESSGATGAVLDGPDSSPGVFRFRGDANMSRFDTPHDTPNLSLSELVSSPPSVDTGIDDNIVHTSVITPEDRHFPTISSPPRVMDHMWAPRGALGMGEGFGGGPQRDERGKKIDSRRWRLADPLTNPVPRTAVDVYTNDKPGKPKAGMRERFSQSVLNLLGDSKKGKARASEKNLREPGSSQWPRKTTKAEKRKSVNDLLGPSAPRATYAWEDPVDRSAQKETPGARARRIFFGRSDRNLANRLRDPKSVNLPTSKIARSGSAVFPPQTDSTTRPPPGMRKLPFSPSMPALPSSLNAGRTASDIRIQTWLNTSQAALSDWEHTRYNLEGVDAQRPPQVSPTPLAPFSFTKNALSPSNVSQTAGFSTQVPPDAKSPVHSADYGLASRDSPYHVLQPAPPAEEPHKEGRRKSILHAVALRKTTANVAGPEKQPKRRSASINKFTTWLGFGRSKSSRTLDQGVRDDDRSVHPPVTSSRFEPSISQSTSAPRLSHYINARTGSNTILPIVEQHSGVDDTALRRRRRSGSDWFGGIGAGRRKTEKHAYSTTLKYPEIILLSAEHLPPPTINEQGFLQSSAPLASEAKLSETYLALHGIRQAEPSDVSYALLPTALPSTAIQMERDLSRLTEGDEDGVGQFGMSQSPVVSSELPLATHSVHRRKPTPPFLDSWTIMSNSLAVPSFETDKKRSKHIKRYPNTLSIGSMSSLSTGITDGDEPAIISAVRSSPIHEYLPSNPAPTIARGVSLDLSALTADERQAVGLGAPLHIPPITSTYPFPQAV